VDWGGIWYAVEASRSSHPVRSDLE
jgi:hypothetical protein